MFYLRLSSYLFTLQLFGILTMVAAVFLSSNTAAAGSLKYTHGPLVSALSGRSHDYGAPASSAGGAGGSDAVEGSGGDDGAGSINGVAVTTLDGRPAVSGGGGGEILVPKSFPMSSQEPTCEQLRAMWIFSKRQSRAAEITNEIPTYRDPFAYNVWEPYYSTTRSLGAVRMVPRYSERMRSPVFGRVINREPLIPQRISMGHQLHLSKAAVGPARIYGAETKPIMSSLGGAGAVRRRPIKYRYIGANGANNGGGSGGLNTVSAAQGSFQKLKELIWTERAKELTQQRRVEELAARAAVLKEISNGQNVHHSSYKHPYKSESPLMDENRSPNPDSFAINDGRASIASGQSQLRGYNGKPYLKSSPRSHVNKGASHGIHKTSIFSGNAASNTGRVERPLLPSMISSSYPIDESRERERIGIPKIYPVRPSLFRERNRSLFKQDSPNYFQRNQRNSAADMETNRKKILLDLIMENFNRRNTRQNYYKVPDEVEVVPIDEDDEGASANSDNLLMGLYDLDADAYNGYNNKDDVNDTHANMNTDAVKDDDNEDGDDGDDDALTVMKYAGGHFSSYLPASVIILEQQLATDLLDYSNYY